MADGSRGGGKGDFEANGQRAEENNFILDGVDNNANVVDFYNGASYVVSPPPDALAEFKVQTSDYSAEFGHSAGAVVNASIKSGTNAFHGSAWEYVRNTAFDIHDWNPNAQPRAATTTTISAPRWAGRYSRTSSSSSATLRLPASPSAKAGTYTVPTALMRSGNLSELLNPAITSDGNAHPIYYQDPTGVAAPVPFPTTAAAAALAPPRPSSLDATAKLR